MPYTAITDDEIAVGKPITSALMQKIKGNDDHFNTVLAGLGGDGNIPNADFDTDSDGDGIPDSWSRGLYPGGTAGLTSDLYSGAKTVWFTHPGGVGNGGGSLLSDYVPAGSSEEIEAGAVLWCSTAGVRCIVQFHYYNAAKVWLSGQAVYDSTSVPTWPVPVIRRGTPPAGTRYFRVQFFIGVDSHSTSGTGYVDKVFFRRIPHVIPGETVVLPTGNSAYSVYSSTGTTPIKANIEAIVWDKGAIRVAWDLQSMSQGYTAYSRVYINGIAVGTIKSTTTLLSASEDVNVNSGDIIHLYGWSSGTYTYIKNVRLKADRQFSAAWTQNAAF